MPALLERGQQQLTTVQANDTRIVTKVRWIVEARNGHLKTIFKMLGNTFNIQNAKHIGEYYRIAGAIIDIILQLICKMQLLRSPETCSNGGTILM